MRVSLNQLWQQNRFFLLFILLMFAFRSAIADWNDVPTGSMKPTILEGDRIFVNKMAYDLRIPFTHVSLFKTADPVRGDIIVFDSEKAGKRLVKRVVGVPGDLVSMRNNVLTINGNQLRYQNLDGSHTDHIEDLPGLSHAIRTNPGRHNPMASFATVEVPDDHYLAMGDNRDNSADSRVIGFVPRQEIVGRTRSVVLSFNHDNYYIPRADRFFDPL